MQIAPTPSSPPTKTEIANESIKPRQGSFLFGRVVGSFVVASVFGLAIAALCYALNFPLALGLLAFIAMLGLGVFGAKVAYRKERYELTRSTLIGHQGGLTSDQRTEVEITNITYVTMMLPWIRHRLFGIGTISVYTAGNAQPVVLRDIRQPQEVYERLMARMKLNGYRLQKRKLLHEESPAILGVLGDSARIAISALVTVAFSSTLLVGAHEFFAELGLTWIVAIVAFLLSAGALGYLVVFYLDMRRRTYRVYDDVVVFHEGFLTRRDAFIPYENIADASTHRTFFDQIFNLYDVVVSCQGSSTEIKFRRLKNGHQLTQSIETLVTEANRKAATKSPMPSDLQPNSDERYVVPTGNEPLQSQTPRRNEPQRVAPEDAWTAELTMNSARAFMPTLLLLPIFPAFVAAIIAKAIAVFSMRFSVRQSSVRHTYQFLSTKEREFVYDKITGLVIKENIFDRFFKTFTLRFWSIGSGQSIEFAHVLRADVDLDALLRQIGIPQTSTKACEIPTAFSVSSWFRKNVVGLLFMLSLVVGFAIFALAIGEALAMLLPILFALMVVIHFFYERGFYQRQTLTFKGEHIEATQGIITRSSYFARYGNVKKNVVTQYPRGTAGSLQTFVAGEQSPPLQNQNSTQGIALPCAFTLAHLPNAFVQSELLDDVLMGRVDVAPNSVPAAPLKTVAESKKALGNDVFILVVMSVLAFPLLPFLPLTIPLTMIGAKRYRYRVDAGRVVASWGIFFKQRASVLLDRVDSLQERQFFLNKLFRNGRVSVMTAGSSKPDLVLAAVVEHQRIYREIKARSKRG